MTLTSNVKFSDVIFVEYHVYHSKITKTTIAHSAKQRKAVSHLHLYNFIFHFRQTDEKVSSSSMNHVMYTLMEVGET